MIRRTLTRLIILILTLVLPVYGANPIPVQAATPSIIVSPITGPPGTSVTVTGSDFYSYETGVTVTYDGITAAPLTTAGSVGGWTITFNIPDSVTGAHIIDAYGSTTSNVTDKTFTVSPDIKLSPQSGAPGTSVTVNGVGFAASESGITVTFDGNPAASSTTASSVGSWGVTFKVPAAASGQHTIDAYGSTTSAYTVPDKNFTISPTISVSPTTGAPGTSITVTGSGFATSETGITVTYDGSTVASGITASAEGSWSAKAFAVPASASGSHTIDAYGSTTTAATVNDMTFTVSPSISINKTSGAAGNSITVTGTGFAAGETGITVTFDGKSAGPATTANSQGGWSTTLVVPASAAGPHTIDASGAATTAASVPDIIFSVGASISLNRASGAAGNSITVTGSGFSAGETGITVTYDGNVVAQGITANADGAWTANFAVPASAAGSHNIGAYGATTSASTIPAAVFVVGASIVLNPASGCVGDKVEITGSGFAANSPIRLTCDDRDIATQGVTSDVAGSFTTSITIPKSKAGGHTISAADTQRGQFKATFTIENTPPSTPTAISPEDGAAEGFLGGTAPTFKWSKVTDPSGVTYVLQIDTTPDFTSVILEKTDISGTRYTLTRAEALTSGEYYWRVKAVDGASNESPWSQSRMLKSGVMSVGVFALILIVAIAVVGAIIYFLVVRRPVRRREAIPAPAAAETPEVVTGQWRVVEPEEATKERALPWRLALPEAKKTKTFSTEDQARIKVIMDFAQSLPLVEPSYNVDWLVDLVKTGTGAEVSVPVYEQLLKGELQVRYEPAWMRHPIYQDLTALLEGQSILEDLNAFVDAANHCVSEVSLLLQEIYRDTIADVSPDFLEKGGWGFISAVYSDAMNWFLGKSLSEPSERDYTIKPGGGPDKETGTPWLWGQENTSFPGALIEAPDEKEALHLRALHLRLRRTFRNNNRARQVAGMTTQLEVQRSGVLNVFSQFGRLRQ